MNIDSFAARVTVAVGCLLVAAAAELRGAAAPPACEAAPGGGTALSSAPTLLATLKDSWHEAWLGSPAVADLDGDGNMEIIAPRHNLMLGWHLDGSVVFRAQTGSDRIWSSPVVADLDPGRAGLEVAAAAGASFYAWDKDAVLLPGFPVAKTSELRALAAADIDGDGALELVAVATQKYVVDDATDVVWAVEIDGSAVTGFPPNTLDVSGCFCDICDKRCYVTGGYDQTLALGDVDGDHVADILAPHDNAYMSLHRGTGWMFDAAAIFQLPDKFAGVRFLFDYALAQQGYPDDESTDNQAHFTNSAPAIADLDGDGLSEIVVLGSVQNAAQTDRERGVGLWVLHSDASRAVGWETPFHAADYLAGLWDLGGNIVAATNQVTVAEIDAAHAGPELIFAGFDGTIHAVTSDKQPLWTYTYTSATDVLTGGVVVADLSGDASPELIFTSYSTTPGTSHLFVLGAGGAEQHKLLLPDRGAMPVPTVADVDGNGSLEIVVSLKDGVTAVRQLLVYTVPGSSTNCLLWPTGRADDRRTGALTPSVVFTDGFESGTTSRWSAAIP